ncbi:MAG: hypothetical protein C0423_18525 [Methylibium sp.]|jgi:hypothetical protein|nr:hypothetical protein [Methylibium sp.]
MAQFISPRPLRLQQSKPRNPLVAPSLMRQAGRHGGAQKTQRQSAQRALRQELQRHSDQSP